MSQDTIAVRSGEELDTGTLERFLHRSLHDLPEEPLEIQQFSGGHSNLTYQLKMGSWEAVLRRPPLGPVAPKAHDMEREYRILSVIHELYSPAPKPLLFSKGEEVIGKPFFLMERKRGIVVDSAFPEDVNATESLCTHISQEMVRQLVRLHSIDYTKTELINISKPEGFMERQVHGWISRYERSKTEDIPKVDHLTRWLASHIPDNTEACLIHYDYKLNNSMFDANLNEMTGLFDWEMSTVGDPLADLGVALSYWMEADDPELLKTGLGKPSVTVMKGFYSRNQFIEDYASLSGRDVSSISFYLTFAYFKLAVICQQIYYRYRKGQTRDSRFSGFHHFVKSLILHASDTAFRN
ncbi:Predicted kinase, aminoglycoside phosphotransferase (APT) family [Fictibacillus enclensis]|uniref:Aminoglycoside phosphotransferase n=1 Tax=Fictibacillus enclensis TaxID=1017270 RepID=A0A0V8JDZ8_9BACL|nr:phosphotransferase family protein [Fictibacillus enclensis]KSU85367.1 aminoglycoside phosphotransferase [Fictibacillus enclensis]SCB95613.1 Predicted kinase, aminoglycoside phosphotransferase (APT) family [Fictibacillus enclensis]